MRTRIGLVAAVFAGYLLAFSPSAATTVWCIGDGGEAGYETVSAAQSSCDDCSHDSPVPGDDDGSLSAPGRCTDIALTSAQGLRRDDPAPAARGVLVTIAHHSLPLLSLRNATGPRSQTALSPPRSSPGPQRSTIVLTI